MDTTIIKYYTKHVYGKPMHYVLDTEKARALVSLTGHKTLLQSDMKALEVLGFTLEEVLLPKE